MLEEVCIEVNGQRQTDMVEPRLLLVHYIREERRLTGTHIGCDTGHCGACTVWLNGDAVKSCTILAVQAHRMSVTTVEGLASDGITPVQESFQQHHGLQCGFCTPGILMTVHAFLHANPHPSREDILRILKGHLCRCTGYQSIVESVENGLSR